MTKIFAAASAAVLSCVLLAGHAHAQSTEQLLETPATTDTPKSETKIQFTLSPSLGRNVVFRDGDTVIDESGYDAAAQHSQPIGSRAKLVFTAGLSGSPEIFDDDAPTSALYGQLGLETKVPLHAEGTGALSPYLRYRHSMAYDRFLEARQYTDDQLLLGATFEDARTISCRVAAEGCGTGLGFSVTGELGALFSDDDSRKRITPKLSGKVSLSLSPDVDLYAKAKLEGRFFTEARTVAGEALEDYLLEQNVGLDFGRLFGLPKPFAMSIEGALKQRWSNEPTREYSRLYFVPALTIGTML